MPRKARIDAPGALHHIIARGMERRKIFYDDADRDNFLGRLGAVLSNTQTQCFAWALLPNHFHLLLRTGLVPIATVMQKLLTGYAISFNRRHRRHGQLFQNRYKSILCEEDAYLLELVRYIHLNPLRSKRVDGMGALGTYPYSGHDVLMGTEKRAWQDDAYVLRRFGGKQPIARKNYRAYVKAGIADGRRNDLIGGGLLRSVGGWGPVKAMRRSGNRIKGDERILGDAGFVARVLEAAQEQLERKCRLSASGYSFEHLLSRVAELMDMSTEEVLSGRRCPKTVQARRLICYWGYRALRMRIVDLAKRLNISQPTASQSVTKGETIVRERNLSLSIHSSQCAKECSRKPLHG